jgi:Acetyltransferase (GNAT) domain
MLHGITDSPRVKGGKGAYGPCGENHINVSGSNYPHSMTRTTASQIGVPGVEELATCQVADSLSLACIFNPAESATQPVLSVRVARSTAEIEQLRPAWSAWCEHPSVDLDAFLAQIRHDGEISEPYVITLYRDGDPDCLLAGRLIRDNMHLSFGGVRLLLPRARLIRIESGGFLGNQGQESSNFIVRALIAALHNKEADSVEFSSLPMESPLYRSATRLPGLLCRDYFPPQMSHCSLSLPASFRTFLDGLSKKRRRNYLASLNGIEKAFPGQFRVRSLDGDPDLDGFLRDCDQIATKTYQRRLNTGFVNDLATREVMKIYRAKGMLWGYVLELASRPVAFVLGVVQGRVLHLLFMAYDPEYSRLSPGAFLLMGCIKELWASQNEIKKVDFGHGNHRYKRELCNEQWTEAAVTMFAPRLKWVGVNALRTGLVLTRRAAARILERPKVRDKAVRLWRGLVLKKRSLANR